MTEFDPEKFGEKYVYYFEELEAAYSSAYQQLHGQYDSQVLKAIDRQVLSESEPVYEGDGEFAVELPEDVEDRVGAVSDHDQFETVLERLTEEIERELRRTFGFE
ncbi:DUF5783 family protein [Natronobacterium gregoryi]|uniref:Uncharacterized protein n=2 Tax=Natronobacterium gregoryi TaxID=44930 RepID=L0ANU0_NATGS|nr:DUF5783 family protein [Natronobacterium gregoryi]AFZ74745.1 hypothetical protein Natgr_3634 [Natronobacterium gregoryi SP2]ELY73447.1 hypothetical protein C490_01240 [Natronobacterium gregoryi SP2]PLK20987.1 hypothetical protein CYV19_06930 [Natronobacterium gregoryi SP2]SFJ03472.1 hypothetical protein SAMN05443661_11212 [Natronobacterium gregoryi]